MSKAPPRTSRLLVVLAFGLGACGGGGKGAGSYPDASTFDGGSTGGAAGSAVGAGGAAAGTGGKGGATVSPGGGGATGLTGGGGSPAAGGASGTTRPTDPPAAGSQLLFSGATLLMGPGVACSTPPAAAAGAAAPDRWCGIFLPGSSGSSIALAVFDVTKALAGAAIICGAGDANCLKLSDAIDTSNSDASYGFFGQTLIYYDATSVYAWRPGWTAGRVLLPHSSSQPVLCGSNAADVPTAICVAQSTGNAYAGTIDTQTGGTLPLIEALGAGSTGIAFSPDDLSVIWSVNTSTTNPAETLKMQTIGDSTTRQTVATDVSSWTVSSDATRWYWLSQPTTDSDGFTTGTLQTAPYPAGTTPAAVQAKVWSYVPYGTKSMMTLANPATISTSAFGADMDAIASVDAPGTPTVVEPKDVIGIIDMDDAGTALYATTAIQPDPTMNNFLVDLRAINADGTGKCAVEANPDADVGALLDRAGTAVEWIQVTLDASNNVTGVTGQVTPLAECAAHAFTSSLYAYRDVSSGLLFQQNPDSSSFTADIAYAPFAASGVPGAASAVQLGADATIAPLFPAPGRVLYTLSGRSSGDGLYASAVIGAASPLAAARPRPLAATSVRAAALDPGAVRARFAAVSLPAPAGNFARGAALVARLTARGPQTARLFSPFAPRGPLAKPSLLPRPSRVAAPKASPLAR